jgi:hypothetical protein
VSDFENLRYKLRSGFDFELGQSLYIVTYRVVHATNKTDSSSDDWIYELLCTHSLLRLNTGNTALSMIYTRYNSLSHTHISPLHNLQFLCRVFTNLSKGDYSAYVARWLTLHRWNLNWLPIWIWNDPEAEAEAEAYCRQPAGTLSPVLGPRWDPWPYICSMSRPLFFSFRWSSLLIKEGLVFSIYRDWCSLATAYSTWDYIFISLRDWVKYIYI